VSGVGGCGCVMIATVETHSTDTKRRFSFVSNLIFFILPVVSGFFAFCALLFVAQPNAHTKLSCDNAHKALVRSLSSQLRMPPRKRRGGATIVAKRSRARIDLTTDLLDPDVTFTLNIERCNS
jgi:hypothetical protein